jgi:sugar lactone lactonase YvrE
VSQAEGYVWGPINAEDLMGLPESQWVITSGMTGVTASQGRLYAVDSTDFSCSEVFPYVASYSLDERRFGHLTAPDPLRFEPHGIDVVRLPDGVIELYVVNHGGRESVEVFQVSIESRRPSLQWVGAAELPALTFGNDVAALGDGGFVVSFNRLPDPAQEGRTPAEPAGETGGVLEWSPVDGWSILPGAGIYSANGIAVSGDGAWVYLAGWHSQCIKKVRRGGSAVESRTVDTEILTDNLTWTSDGRLLAAGAFNTTPDEFIAGHFSSEPRLLFPSRVLRVDPESLAIETLIEYGPETFGAATTGLHVKDQIWVGAARDQGLARFAYPAAAGRG